jgi:IclR family transcriptional regulator, mhp operon transcriptional activator
VSVKPGQAQPSTSTPHSGGHYSKTRAHHDAGRLSIVLPIPLEGRVLGCLNLTWRMKLMTVAEVTRRHLDDRRGAVLAAERQATEATRRQWDRVGVDEV